MGVTHPGPAGRGADASAGRTTDLCWPKRRAVRSGRPADTVRSRRRSIGYGAPKMATSDLPPALREAVARLGSADIMVGIPSYKNAATIGYVVRAAQAGLVQYFPDLRPVVVNADAGSPDGTQRVVVETEPPDYVERILLVRPRNRLQRISLTYPEVDGVGGKGAALRTIFQIAQRARGRGAGRRRLGPALDRARMDRAARRPGAEGRLRLRRAALHRATSTTARSRTRSPTR